MRAALICLADGAQPVVAGRSAAQCQLELARACGCSLIIVHGHGASADAIALRHLAENAGLRFQTVNDAHALIGAVGPGDSLLVLQPMLWPTAEEARAALLGDACVVVLPAGAGSQAGFERIDLDRAWAGALVLPGELVAELGALPGDAAPAPALLRVALQARLPEARLPATRIEDGSWSLLRSPEAALSQERKWLRLTVGDRRGSNLSQWLAQFLLHVRGGALAGWRWRLAAPLGALVLALVGALAAAWFDYPAAAFALVALAAPLPPLVTGLARLGAPLFSPPRQWRWLGYAVDVVLAGCGVLAIEGLWQRALFAPAVMLAALLLLDRRAIPPAAEVLRDRGAVALALALAMLLLPPEAAVMLVAAALLAVNLAPIAPQRG